MTTYQPAQTRSPLAHGSTWRRRSRGLATALVCAWSLISGPLAAEPSPEEQTEGKALAGKAIGHYRDGSYPEALQLFSEARALYPTGQVLRMSGYTLLAMRRWIEAADTLEAALATDYKPLEEDDAAHARKSLEQALAKISVATISSEVAGAMLEPMGPVEEQQARALPVTIKLLAGTHRFVVSAPGHDNAESERTLAAGSQVDISLTPQALPEEPPAPVKVDVPAKPDSGSSDLFPHQATVGLIIGGAGIAVGGVALAQAIYGGSLRSAVRDNTAAHNQVYDAQCSTNRSICQADIASINSDARRAEDHQNAALVLGITGAALFVTGGVLFVLSEDGPFATPRDEPRDALGCAPLASSDFAGLTCAGLF